MVFASPDVILAHRHCTNHREEIARSEMCGCFFCRETFVPGEILEWVDGIDTPGGVGTTALCPRCGIDAVLGSAAGYPLTAAFLAAMYEHWFVASQPLGNGLERWMTMERIGTVEAVQVGSPQRYVLAGEAGRSWESSFVRVPSGESRWLFMTHLAGNEQADKQNHGKPSQAVLLYAAAHYPRWREELGRPELGPGGFAENLTVAGLDEGTACIGDLYAIGAARIRVTGPRYPCTKIERRWDEPGLTARVAATGRTGWYCATEAEGAIAPGAAVALVERPYPRWTVALVNDFGHGRNGDAALARELAGCPLLSEFWRGLVVRGA